MARQRHQSGHSTPAATDIVSGKQCTMLRLNGYGAVHRGNQRTVHEGHSSHCEVRIVRPIGERHATER